MNKLLHIVRNMRQHERYKKIIASPLTYLTGAVLLGEVSQCNDDNTDNRFNPPVGRFPKIEEDEPPYRLLCNEYPATK